MYVLGDAGCTGPALLSARRQGSAVNTTGTLVISIDFELMWGVRDHRTMDNYGPNIRGVRTALPAMLDLFAEFNIAATFATVGLLFAKNKEEMITTSPAMKPRYTDAHLSPFNGHFDIVGKDEANDPYHFAPALIEVLKRHPQHEIGTHTFSHYYCLEPGQNVDEFDADLAAAISIARKSGIELKSIVFPRNQFSEAYLAVCRKNGIICYRGNEAHWVHRPVPGSELTLLRRAVRLADHYINITGHHTPRMSNLSIPLIDVPASRFLRPYSPSLRMLDPLRLRRMSKSMTNAARTGGVFHLWWHPHNFGVHEQENMAILRMLLQHFSKLKTAHGMRNETMLQVAERIQRQQGNG